MTAARKLDTGEWRAIDIARAEGTEWTDMKGDKCR